MNAQKLTQKSLEAISNAQTLATENSNQQIEQEHLVMALVDDNGLISEIFSHMGIDINVLKSRLTDLISIIPKITMSGRSIDNVYISPDTDKALKTAENEAQKMGDEYISVEHIMIGIFENINYKLNSLFKDLGITKNAFLKILKEVRGNVQVTNQNPEDTYNVLEKYGQELVKRARENKIDPVIRKR